MHHRGFFLLLAILLSFTASAQEGIIRGNVFDDASGEPVMFATVRLLGTNTGTTTNEEGFFSLLEVAPGNYTVVVSFIGYDSVATQATVKPGEVVYLRMTMKEAGVNLGVVDVTGTREQARTEVQVSKVRVTPKRINAMPSVGGQPDLAQYLPVLPGVIFTGDQGGQLYIRGGSPDQNRVLLDGMTIFNPFHSIGFFSVFETETIRSIDVFTGGFSAEYGGRVSAVLDIKTREGNKKRLSGVASINPFQGKLLLEGPIVPLREDGQGGSLSFILTGKTSIIQETSKSLYRYASDTSFFNLGIDRLPEEERPERATPEEVGLPFSFTDLYGKISLVAGNGSKLNLFGFNFNDRVQYPQLGLDWDSYGLGFNFAVLPPNTNLAADGTFAFSDYEVVLNRANEGPRRSRVSGFNLLMNFTNFHKRGEVRYGVEFNGIRTELEFRNFRGITFEFNQNTTEIAPYAKYRGKFGNLVIEPSVRAHFYASLGDLSIEPRLGMKYNATPWLRFKLATGLFSQNLISTVSDLDLVNLFVGFIADPNQTFNKPASNERTDHRLQKSVHLITGMEVDLTPQLTLNVEPYIKHFPQLITINRNKSNDRDSDFATETGQAMGLDVSLKYETREWYFWWAYSLGKVTRDDGFEEYPPIFDRRHNTNILVTRTFGKDLNWEVSGRWNYGTGFPFTQIQGFSSIFLFNEGLSSDPLTENPDLYIIPSQTRNGGRLPVYSRLDFSLKYTHQFSKNVKLETVASVTNAMNRDNIFFFVVEENQRIDQLPILPSLGLTLSW